MFENISEKDFIILCMLDRSTLALSSPTTCCCDWITAWANQLLVSHQAALILIAPLLVLMHLRGHLLCFLCLMCVFVHLGNGRVRYKYRKRTECKDEWPRRADDLSKIVLSGVVQQPHPPTPGSQLTSASVYVKWVLKGPEPLEGARITVDGFGQPNSCYPAAKKFDSLILILEESAEGLYRLNGTVFRVSLNNIDRIQAVIADQPFRRRADIADLPCEVHYCPFNADCVEESDGRPTCRCVTSCPSSDQPVCGSNQETFASECRMRAESCLRNENIFIRHVGSCDERHRIRSSVPEYVRARSD